MLANHRSRTVFGLQHKYSKEYIERSSGTPLGSFEAQILELRRTGDTPIIKRKASTARLVGTPATDTSVPSPGASPSCSTSSTSKGLLRPSFSVANLDTTRNLAVHLAPDEAYVQGEEEAEGTWSGRLSTSGHLAGALRRSCLRKAAMAEAKDPRRPAAQPTAVPLNALDCATPALALDCPGLSMGANGFLGHSLSQSVGANAFPGLSLSQSSRDLLEAALADGPQGDVFL
mmetsp:Transcript_96020/g.222590  ORF Transcript_96020/g.222590 Transcript_96020/m.222590 type:complete len:231 (-) Transcript_96020:78-770(-)